MKGGENLSKDTVQKLNESCNSDLNSRMKPDMGDVSLTKNRDRKKLQKHLLLMNLRDS